MKLQFYRNKTSGIENNSCTESCKKNIKRHNSKCVELSKR